MFSLAVNKKKKKKKKTLKIFLIIIIRVGAVPCVRMAVSRIINGDKLLWQNSAFANTGLMRRPSGKILNVEISLAIKNE